MIKVISKKKSIEEITEVKDREKNDGMLGLGIIIQVRNKCPEQGFM